MTLSAFDSIHRGLVNLRANWELVLVQFLQILIGAILVLVGFVPPLAVLGFTDLDVLDSTGEDWAALMESATGLVTRGREAWVLLLASMILSAAIWTMAMLIHCFFQGGIYGVLMAGDRQAPAGKPLGWAWFRTFSVRHLRGWGTRYLWRYFWLMNLFLGMATAWLVLPVMVFLLSVWGEARWGSAASFGIGCGGFVIFAFSLFVLAFWFSLAQADLAREDSSVLKATRRGLLVLSRRLGAMIVLAVLGAVVSLSVTFPMVMIGTLGQLGLGSGLAVQLLWQVAFNLAQWLLSCVLGVAFIAILVALVRSEVPQGAAA